jgi:hypothetical protein
MGVEGREIMGKQSSWLVTLKGFDTPEKVNHCAFASFHTFNSFLGKFQIVSCVGP